jgi:hypothetical protein
MTSRNGAQTEASSVLACGLVQPAPPYEWSTLFSSMNTEMEREKRMRRWFFIPAEAAKGSSLIGMHIAVNGEVLRITSDSGPAASTLWRLREVGVHPQSFSFAVRGLHYEFAILAPPSERISMDHLMHLRTAQGDKVSTPSPPPYRLLPQSALAARRCSSPRLHALEFEQQPLVGSAAPEGMWVRLLVSLHRTQGPRSRDGRLRGTSTHASSWPAAAGTER